VGKLCGEGGDSSPARLTDDSGMPWRSDCGEAEEEDCIDTHDESEASVTSDDDDESEECMVEVSGMVCSP
jgi:hypothetical protein